VFLGALAWHYREPTPTPVAPQPSPAPAPRGVEKKNASRPSALSVRIWRARRYVDLVDAVPVKKGDEIRIQTMAPADMHAALFAINQAGQVRLLAQRAPAPQDAPLAFPEAANLAAPLAGKPGNEFILMCARRTSPVPPEHVSELLGKIQAWPMLPLDSVLGITPEFVKVQQAGRDLGPVVERPDPEGDVKQELEALQKRLAARFEHFEGLIFSHER
jgi:hypothetical protein